jgi:hypothetical protein
MVAVLEEISGDLQEQLIRKFENGSHEDNKQGFTITDNNQQIVVSRAIQ